VPPAENAATAERIACTNTVPVPEAERTEKLRILSIAPAPAPALAEAVRRIHNGESVSALFDAPRSE
jgi:ribose-phosphate pyrophosphokinase